MGTEKKKAKSKGVVAAKRRKKPVAVPRGTKKTSGRLSGYFLPGVLSLVILACIGFLGVRGYQTVTASEFFDVKKVDVRGVNRASKEDIEKIIASQTQHSGVLNADLIDIKARVEKLTFVKTAAVSRILPNGIRISVVERRPQAIVSLSSGDYLIDENGDIITAAKKGEEQAPLIIRGWDETKTEKALKDNQQRMKVYQKMVADWSNFELVKRVKEVNLSDLQEPRAVIEDSGSPITVALAKDNFGKNLRDAIEAVAGKGQKVRAVDVSGLYPIIDYLGN